MFKEGMRQELKDAVMDSVNEYPYDAIHLLYEMGYSIDICHIDDVNDRLYSLNALEILDDYSWIDTDSYWVDFEDCECYDEYDLPWWVQEDVWEVVINDVERSEEIEDMCGEVYNYIQDYTCIEVEDLFESKFSTVRGSCIGWKKAYLYPLNNEFYFMSPKTSNQQVIVKLFIPATAERTRFPVGQKNRCEYAEVLGFYDLDGNELDILQAFSQYDANFRYIKGFKVVPSYFNTNLLEQCAGGIHYFETFNGAKHY